jgi:predicted nuclease with TOPRIM domain
MNIQAEISELKRRVGDLEGALSVLTGQLNRVHPELVTLQKQTAASFEKVEGLMERLVVRVDTMTTHIWSLRDDLPGMMVEALHKSGQTS